MEYIVCAIRGGEGSWAVQQEAIRLARAESKRLIFLNVIDVASFGNWELTLSSAIRAELNWLGKALVNVAQRRARKQQIVSDVAIREGDVRQEIGQFLQESAANMLLLGAPRGTTATVFGDDAIEQFALSVHNETGVPVHIVRPRSVRG
jgi:nucleotide-binding universal stress UspA family protein